MIQNSNFLTKIVLNHDSAQASARPIGWLREPKAMVAEKASQCQRYYYAWRVGVVQRFWL